MKKKFDIKDYPGDVAMHCDTEEKAKVFCRYLDSIGKRWCGGNSYLEKTYWDVYKTDACYAFNEGAYQDLEFSKEYNYTILEFDDFNWSFNPETDIKAGYKEEKLSNEEMFRKMWRFKAKHPEMDSEEVVEAFYEEYGITDIPKAHCYACEECDANCYGCPLVLGGMKPCTYYDDSPYHIEMALREQGHKDADSALCKDISEFTWGEKK